MVRYILSSVGSTVQLDRRCPHCGFPHGSIHSSVRRRRLSYRGVAQFLPCLDCCGSKSTIERDVIEAGQKATDLHRSAPRMRVRVLGVDGTGDAMAARKGGVLFFADVERQKLLLVEPIRETEAAKLRRHVRTVFAMVGAQELRTDEHSVYEGVVGEDHHKLCLTHWRKSKGKRAWDLHRQPVAEDKPLEAETMKQLLELLRQKPRPPTVPKERERLVGRYIRARKGLPWKVNQLLQHVERTWEKVSDDPVDVNTLAVQYAYEDGVISNAAKYVRLDKVTYPNSCEVYYNYPSSDIGGVLSRLDNIAKEAARTNKYAQYTYMGASKVVKVSHPGVPGYSDRI